MDQSKQRQSNTDCHNVWVGWRGVRREEGYVSQSRLHTTHFFHRHYIFLYTTDRSTQAVHIFYTVDCFTQAVTFISFIVYKKMCRGCCSGSQQDPALWGGASQGPLSQTPSVGYSSFSGTPRTVPSSNNSIALDNA